MWRLLLALLSVTAVGGAIFALPGMNGEKQLHSNTRIAADSGAGLSDHNGSGSLGTTATAQPRGDDGAGLPPAANASAPGGEADDQALLVENLQRQLRRTGCYKGPIDGKWSISTKRAVVRFDTRTRTLAMLEAPSRYLLWAVAAHADRACGAPCPAGSLPDAAGYCSTAAHAAAFDQAAIRPTPPPTSIAEQAWPATDRAQRPSAAALVSPAGGGMFAPVSANRSQTVPMAAGASDGASVGAGIAAVADDPASQNGTTDLLASPRTTTVAFEAPQTVNKPSPPPRSLRGPAAVVRRAAVALFAAATKHHHRAAGVLVALNHYRTGSTRWQTFGYQGSMAASQFDQPLTIVLSKR